ncbi:MAG: M12 family metallo-peptidase [Opitutaceae bacterium]
MTPSSRFATTLLGSFIAVATLAFFLFRPPALVGPDSVVAGRSEVRAQNSKGTSGVTRIPVRIASVSRAISSVAPRTLPSVPAAVRDLIPSIEAAVSNWKEFKPQKITVAPYPDLPIEFEMTSIHEEHGRTVWTGRNPLVEGAFLVTAATAEDWQAVLSVPGAGTFDLRIAGSFVEIKDSSSVQICGAPRALNLQESGENNASETREEAASPVASADSLTTVDVVFFYDDATLTQAGSATSFETRMIAHVAAGNVALENSAVTNFRWRYLASYQVPVYAATSDMTDDLYTITGRKDQGVDFTNPVSDFATAKAVLHGADQLVLYVGGTRNYGGIAWSVGQSNFGSPLSLRYHTAVVAFNSSYGSLAHELGHNFGCQHDRETDAVADTNGFYNYGFRFLRNGRDTGTIMSYAGTRVDYFSNPDVTANGVALGVPETQPKAANNARVLRDSAQSMIASRIAVDAPAITSQPQSATLFSGQAFALNVTATGTTLVYQWNRAGVAISGATTSSYSKSGALETDGGSYSVTVSNIAGQVISAVATVTVTAAPPTSAPTTSGGGGGGGGGGGAMDAWFACGGGLFVMARCILKKAVR